MSFVQVHNLSYHHQQSNQGIQDISFSLDEGEFTILAGHNGCGKTTLAKHLNGLLQPQRGHVIIDNIRVHEEPHKARCIVGMVFQNADTQIVGETVYQDIAFGPENLKWERKIIHEVVLHTAQTVGLVDLLNRPTYSLSGGEKKKLALAGVLAMQPRFIIFDEPFANLDFQGSQDILKQIFHLKEKKHTILLLTHDLEKTISYADRLLIMTNGKLVANDKPQALLENIEQFGVRRPCSVRLGQGVTPWLD